MVQKHRPLGSRREVVFELAKMDAFELEYDFVHVKAFTYILS